MSVVPRFVRTFQRSFERQIVTFLQTHREIARRLDRRLEPHVQRLLTSLRGGKRLRPLLVALGYEAAGGKDYQLTFPAGLAVELFHHFALIHDDIIDRATERRGRPTIQAATERRAGDPHAGLSTAMLAGDLLLTQADQFDRLRLPAARRLAARAAWQRMTEETVLGQQLEFDLARSPRFSFDDIVRAMIFKSGRYSIAWPLTIGAILAGAHRSSLRQFSSFSLPLGLAFQLRDDLLGVFGQPSQTGKSRDSDIREGKRTLLIYFAQREADSSERRWLARTVGHQTATAKNVSRVRAIMTRTGARRRVEALAADLTATGLTALNASRLDPATKQKLQQLARYLLVRDV